MATGRSEAVCWMGLNVQLPPAGARASRGGREPHKGGARCLGGARALGPHSSRCSGAGQGWPAVLLGLGARLQSFFLLPHI